MRKNRSAEETSAAALALAAAAKRLTAAKASAIAWRNRMAGWRLKPRKRGGENYGGVCKGSIENQR